MKNFRVLMGTLALAMAAVIFFACSKEKESNVVQQTTENNERKPIATYDNATGKMTYHFDMSEIQQKMNAVENAKTEQDRYVVESIVILDNAPSDIDVMPEIKITILDVEEECSYTTWCMDYFTDKRVSTTSTSYYLDEEVASKNFTCYTTNGTNYQITFVNGGFTITEDPSLPDNAFRPKWFFTCRAENCSNGNCEKEKLGDYHYTCSDGCPSGGTCKRVTIIDMIIEVADAISNFFS